MVSNCLNPHCFAVFKYLGRGRLFRINFIEERIRSAMNGKKIVASIRSKANPIEHFWLCEKCAATLTIKLSEAGEVRLVPLGPPAQKITPAPTKQSDASLGKVAS